MASVKVLKPTQPVNLLNTPVAPKPYTLSYYDWLSTQGTQYYYYGEWSETDGTPTTYVEDIIEKSQVLMVTSLTLGATFNAIAPTIGQGRVRFMVSGTNECLGMIFLDNANNAAVPQTIVKTFNPPFRITGAAIELRIDGNMRGFYDIQGYKVPKSILFN